MSLMEDLSRELGKRRLPAVHVGDTVEVHYNIKEGDKERVQVFAGTVLSISGRGVARSITVRRLVRDEGVERIFPLHSPRVQDVKINRRGDVRRAKLFYLRDRVGKRTRVTELLGEKVRRDRDREKAERQAAEDEEAAEKAKAAAAAAAAAATTGADAEPEAVEV